MFIPADLDDAGSPSHTHTHTPCDTQHLGGLRERGPEGPASFTADARTPGPAALALEGHTHQGSLSALTPEVVPGSPQLAVIRLPRWRWW